MISMRLLLLAAILALAACAHRAPQVQPQRPTPAAAQAAASVTAPHFGDAHAVRWDGPQPAAYPIHGVDISVWQGEVDWRTARAKGVSFAYMKATEGGDLVDPAFAHNWQTTAAAGVPRGAYHFFYHCRPAIQQARWYIAHVPKQRALPPVLDMEWTPRSPTCPNKRPAATIRSDAQIYLRAIASHYGKRPIFYTTVDFYKENELWKLTGTDFWLRSVAAHPSDSFPGQHWLLWQYSGTGLVPGIQGQTDLDAYAGTPAEFATWLAQ